MNIKDDYGYEYKPFSDKEKIFITVSGKFGNIVALVTKGKKDGYFIRAI